MNERVEGILQRRAINMVERRMMAMRRDNSQSHTLVQDSLSSLAKTATPITARTHSDLGTRRSPSISAYIIVTEKELHK